MLRGLGLVLFGVGLTWLLTVVLGRAVSRRGFALWVWDRSGSIGRLLIDEHVVAEPAGAAATAAFLKAANPGSSNVVSLLTGANLSNETLQAVAQTISARAD